MRARMKMMRRTVFMVPGQVDPDGFADLSVSKPPGGRARREVFFH